MKTGIEEIKKGTIHKQTGHPKGEDHGLAKLTNDDVLKIRQLYSETYTQLELAELFGVSQMTISRIVTRKTWRHI